jgi:dihydroorotate dehydrogenase (NAD+) catalytic subunit
MVKTDISLGKGLTLKNQVLTASGTFGYGEEFQSLIPLNRLGGIIVKGTTLNPRQGNPYPRMAETPSGMLNAVGLQNKGVDYFVENIYPRIKDCGTEIFVNVSGSNVDDYAQVCEKLVGLDGIAGIEVNISCPNVKQGGMAFGTSPKAAAQVTRVIRDIYPGFAIIKLSPNVTDISEIALAVESEGADAVSLTNTFLGMSIDVERRKPHLSTITGGLSGPCIRPIAVRMVWQVAKAVKIPVIGLGGIVNGEDALQFILAGASAIQVGTANFINPAATIEIIDYIEEYCSRHGVDDVNELIGALNVG